MKKVKSMTGITLVALVVTIIVLIILAGVSISLVTSEDGIIAKAKEAAEQMEIETEKEQIAIAVVTLQADKIEKKENYIITAEELEQELAKTIEDVTVTDNGDGTLSVIYSMSNREYILDEQRNIIEMGNVENDVGITVNEDTIKLTRDIEGTVVANNPTVGREMYLNFEVEADENYTNISINPTLPYKITQNGNYTFTITGTEQNGETKEIRYTAKIKNYKEAPQNYLRFNGTSYISTDINQSEIIPEFTIATKIKINRDEQTRKNWIGIFGNHLGNTGIHMQFIEKTTKLNEVNVDYTNYYDDWVDFVYIYSNQKIKIYIDGNYLTETTRALTPYSNFYIGTSYLGDDRRIYGEMSCFKVWQKALTEEEVKSLDLFKEEVDVAQDKLYRNIILKSEEEVNKVGSFVGTGHTFINNN